MSHSGTRSGIAALECWLRLSLADYPIKVTNMTTSWQDGRAFCALIHRYRPQLLHFSQVSPTDGAANLALAFRLAEEELGVPALLEVKDVLRRPDRLSMLTYLSQFYHALSGPDSGISSLSGSATSSDSETEWAGRGRCEVGRRGTVLSLLGQARRARSLVSCRPASPPIEQENPFTSEAARQVEVVAGPSRRLVMRHHRDRAPRHSARRQVQSMYVEAGAPLEARARPRSMLQALSYARPYTPAVGGEGGGSQVSMVDRAYRRSRSMPPVTQTKPTTYQTMNKQSHENFARSLVSLKNARPASSATNSCNPEDRFSDKTDNTNHTKMVLFKTEETKEETKEEPKETGNILRNNTVVLNGSLKKGFSGSNCKIFKKTKHNLDNFAQKHFQRNLMPTAHYPGIQTLV